MVNARRLRKILVNLSDESAFYLRALIGKSVLLMSPREYKESLRDTDDILRDPDPLHKSPCRQQ